MNLYDYTEPELDVFRKKCNFVGFEREVFEYRSKAIPLEEIAEKINMSVDGTKRISRKVNSKVDRIAHL